MTVHYCILQFQYRSPSPNRLLLHLLAFPTGNGGSLAPICRLKKGLEQNFNLVGVDCRTGLREGSISYWTEGARTGRMRAKLRWGGEEKERGDEQGRDERGEG